MPTCALIPSLMQQPICDNTHRPVKEHLDPKDSEPVHAETRADRHTVLPLGDRDASVVLAPG